MFARLRAYLLVGVWAVGLGVFGPLVIPLTLLTKREEFILLPTWWVIALGNFLAGLKIVVRGRENVDPFGTYVYVANHQSILDPPLVWQALGTPRRRPGFLVKKEIGKVPVLGYGCQQIGMLLIDRSNSERALDTARRATASLQSGRSFTVFAEGTRTRDGRLLPFKKGAFHMAIDAGVPVVPVTISGAFEALPRDSFKLRSVPIVITIHEPISTEGMTNEDIPSLLARTQAIVDSGLGNPSVGSGV